MRPSRRGGEFWGDHALCEAYRVGGGAGAAGNPDPRLLRDTDDWNRAYALGIRNYPPLIAERDIYGTT